MLFVPGLRNSRLSILALEGVGYAMVFKSEHIFIYPVGVDLVDPVLIGHQIDGEYVMCGQPTSLVSRWITLLESKTDKEREAPRIDVATSSQSLVQRKERDAPKIEVVSSIQSSIQGST